MTETEIKITQEEKINTLKTSAKAIVVMIPFLFLLLLGFSFFGFSFPLLTCSVILLLSWGFAFFQLFLLKKRWIIDLSYGGLFTVVIVTLIALGIYYSGNVLSPFVWVAIFVSIFNTLNYDFKRGMLVATFFASIMWFGLILESFKIIPCPIAISGFDPALSPRLVPSILFGYTLIFMLGPIAVGYLSEQLRQEKRQAAGLLDEKGKSYRMSLSIMEDLELAKSQLEQRLKDYEDSRRATLHLLSDVEEERNLSQKRAEEIKKLYEELKVVDRMKTEFLAVVSHELRTPMTPIRGYSNLLLSGQLGEVKPEQQRAIGIIKKQGEHLLELIDSILDLSRMMHEKRLKLEKEPISVKTLVNELIEVMQPQSEAREITISARLPEDFPTLLADHSKLRRVITNLLGNALKFTPKGGLIKVVGLREDGTVQIQVIDNGIGIAKEQLARVFDKFYQVDGSYTRATGGVGLGLAIAKEIVLAHGGKIWVESAGLGRGTKFCFTLPLGGE